MTTLKPGEVLAVKTYFGFEHQGIATGCGTVISGSQRAGCVVEESVEDFAQGGRPYSKGYPSNLLPYQVIANARARIGRKWNLFTYNCEHFASECHGKKQSLQLQGVTAIVVGTFFFVAAVRGKAV